MRPEVASLPALRTAPGELLGSGKSATVRSLCQDSVFKHFHASWPWSAVDAEVQAARLAFEQGIATPRVLDVVRHEGRAGIVFERIDGLSLAQALRRHPWRAAGYLAAFADLHLEIHRRQAPGLRPQHMMLSYSVNQLKDEPESHRGNWTAQLEASAGTALSHNDFHAHNIMLRDSQMLVIDWGKGAMGSGLLDAVLAYLKMRQGPRTRGRAHATLARAAAERYASCYLRASGEARTAFDALIPAAEASLRRDG